ncbi:hypothetical protein RHGRI_015373 [Rhododendron griersonianum]|uniref:Carbohydrate kinase PfkB domain-containing protein n=1 Tax=Rhododendron griersonianum TaxID=479676 RepID=A0AAV6KD12_9ERIC|nr:hypothetical protein RHGRI_015373 [Rhododendron griersonianum]
MAPPLQLLQSPLLLHPHLHLHLSHPFSLLPHTPFRISTTCSIPPPKPHKFRTPKPPRASVNADQTTPTKPTRRKKTPSTSSTTPKPKTRKPKTQKGTTEPNEPLETQEETVITKDPELICCLGGARKEFVPTVRVAEVQMHPDMYSQWKMLQWKPPVFARAPSGPASNVAIAHVRLGGRTEFMGKVGRDGLGEEMVELIEKERVGTRGMKVDESGRTGRSYMRVKFDEDEGKVKVETVRESAEDLFFSSSNLFQASMLHFNSEALMSPPMHSAVLKAISLSKKFGGLIFFDLNLPMPLWKSHDVTRELIKRAWEQADILEMTKYELEFLLDEGYYSWRRGYKHQYYAENHERSMDRRDYYHYTREEISPLWHDKLKFLFVTDGTLRIHYYTPSFDGVVVGTEDVLITPMTADRTGSGDAVVAAIIRKLTTQPEMFENQDVLVRQLRFAIAAGIIAQWTIGSVRGLPTASAAQNLKEQVYAPSMW